MKKLPLLLVALGLPLLALAQASWEEITPIPGNRARFVSPLPTAEGGLWATVCTGYCGGGAVYRPF